MSSESVRRRPVKPCLVRVKVPICVMSSSFRLVVVRWLVSRLTGAGPPFEVAVACLVGPDGEHTADDRTARERAEIAAIYAVLGIVHEKEFVVGDAAAALPDGQFAAGFVALARAAIGGAIGKNVEAVATDGLTGKRKDALQQR